MLKTINEVLLKCSLSGFKSY